MDMRTQFEHWFSDQGSNLRAIEKAGGKYKLMQAQSSWLAWQAGWNQSQPAAPQVSDAMAAAAKEALFLITQLVDHSENLEIFEKHFQNLLIKSKQRLEAALAQPGAGGWQPIETAPRDGQWFLCYVPIDRHRQFLGLYSKDGILLNEFAQPAPFPPSHWKRLDSGPKEPGEGE